MKHRLEKVWLEAGRSERDKSTVRLVLDEDATREKNQKEKGKDTRIHREFTIGVCISYKLA